LFIKEYAADVGFFNVQYICRNKLEIGLNQWVLKGEGDMERDFRYLRDQHGDAGAREIFEKICSRLFSALFGADAHNIKVSQEDEGIDVLVGDFSAPIDVYQCKYFIDGVGNSQKQQIRDSFKRAIESSTYKMKKWTVCLPCELTAK